jgi:hypothetical protein
MLDVGLASSIQITPREAYPFSSSTLQSAPNPLLDGNNPRITLSISSMNTIHIGTGGLSVSTNNEVKMSTRGSAQALLVMPSNLLTAEGLVTVAGGIFIFIVGLWSIGINNARLSDEALELMALGMLVFVWGALVCYGAKQMQELTSYNWAMVASVLGVLPILVGIFGIIMLQNPTVIAGFEEGEGGRDEGIRGR